MGIFNKLFPKIEQRPSTKRLVIGGSVIAFALWLAIFPGAFPISYGFDGHEDTCLPVKGAIIVKIRPNNIKHDEYVLFEPFGLLANNPSPWVVKWVKGIPGDHLVIRDGVVKINDVVITKGMPDAPLYHKSIAEFNKDEIIPDGKYYVIGTHPYSLDSRYWGYLDKDKIFGEAYPVL